MKIRPTEGQLRTEPVRLTPSLSTLSATRAPLIPPPSTAQGPSRFSRLLAGLGRELDHGERTMAAVTSGASPQDPGKLLALQAGIYRYVEAVDLTSKLIDRAANAVKTTLQSQ